MIHFGSALNLPNETSKQQLTPAPCATVVKAAEEQLSVLATCIPDCVEIFHGGQSNMA